MQLAKRTSTDAAAPSGPGRVVLGLGGTIDYEIAWDALVVERLAKDWGIRLEDCDHEIPIRDERDLVRVILGFVLVDHGGERFVESIDTITRFAARFDYDVTLGGTGVRAGLIMRTLGVRSTAHLVSIDDDFRRLFPADCDYLSSARADGMDPHLIVQLPHRGMIAIAGAQVEIRHANRIIFANDASHREMVLSPSLGEALETADVFLISGFNGMTSAALLENRLVELRSAMSRLAPGAIAMYEDAGYHSPSLSKTVDHALGPVVDIFSMNEDELQSRLGRPVDLLDAGDVALALSQLRETISSAAIVVHSRHWALAFGSRAASLAVALRTGVGAATARYIYGDAVSASQVEEVASREPDEAALGFATDVSGAAEEPTVCVPVPSVRADSPTTIGLGDCFVGGFITGLESESAMLERRLEQTR